MCRRFDHSCAIVCLLLLAAGVWGCASEEGDLGGGTTSVAVLGTDNGAATAPSNNGNANTPTSLPQPSYPVRDPNLGLWSTQAWRSLLTRHMGQTDFIETPWLYGQLLEVLATHIEIASETAYVGLAESTYARLATGDYDFDPARTYDEPTFMALGLARLYNSTARSSAVLPHREQYLASAQNYLLPVMAAETTDVAQNSVGVWWDQKHDTRRTANNAAVVMAALEVDRGRPDPKLLPFAQRVYDAWFRAAVDGNTFMVADGVANNGSVDNGQYTYNYGLMIDAAVALHRRTGEGKYLGQARGMAQALIGSMTTPYGKGRALVEPRCSTGGCGLVFMYRGITLRALAHLGAVDPQNAAVQDVLTQTAQAMVASRDAATGHYAVIWTEPGELALDPASDLAAAMALAHLLRTVPQQAPLVPSPLVAYAAESSLGLDLSVLPGGDGQGAWATAGNFTAAQQTMNLSLWAPFAGPYVLRMRYSVPDASSPALVLDMAGNHVPQNLITTGSATTMAVTPPTNLTLPEGRVTAALSATALPARARIDTVSLTPTKTVGGASCTPISTLKLLAPTAGDRLCGAVTFTWRGSSGAQAQSDVFVDGRPVCSVKGSATTCKVPAGTLADGRHTWAVVEDGCSVSPQQAFDVAQKAPGITAAAVASQADGLQVTFTRTPGTSEVTVALDGNVACGRLEADRCIIPSASTGGHRINLTATNACGQTYTQPN